VSDQALLAGALERLERSGVIEYTGEFGAEITTFIPFVCWLKAEGRLQGRRVLTYRGMRPYYYFLDEADYAEKPDTRRWLPVAERNWPSNSSYTATRQPWHKMPDYRARYADEGPAFARPVLFVQNKFCVEWDSGPINYIPLKALEALFAHGAKRFDIIYSRPRRMAPDNGYAIDENQDCDYPDLAVCKRYPGVTVLEEHCAATGAPYNLTKLQILAKSRLFVAVQGGGAHLLACFGDAMMLLLHRAGEEHPHTYAAGPYKYLSSPPPVLMVAHDRDEFMSGLAVIGNAELAETGFRVPESVAPVLNALRV
jgi:hypothetical protein